MKRLACVPFFCLFLSWLIGCTPQGPPPPKAVKVSGTVTLGGAPMKEGEVRFSVEGQPGKSFKIADGKFEGDAFVGKNNIEVVLEEDGPENPTDPKAPRMKVNVIAEKFSGPNSTLNEEVKEAKSTYKFEVTKK